MIRFLLALLLCMGAAFPAQATDSFGKFFPASGENPFPWGSESPFPWGTIDGLYKTTSAPLYFKFEVIRISAASSRYLRVTMINDVNAVLAQGVGVMRDQDQIIRARVVGDFVDAYALVRAYNVKKIGRSCGQKDCAVVVTLRQPETAQTKDLHYVLNKVPKSRVSKPSVTAITE
jgi:hypothetical protein